MEAKLVSLVWMVEESVEEQQRISNLLKDKSHFAASMFIDNILRAKGFSEQAKVFRREIPGFKVGSKNYNKKAAQFVLGKLKANDKYSLFWELYKVAITEYLSSKFPNLREMINNVVIKDAEKIGVDSKFILEQMCEHAAEYDVDEEAIRQAYELWPFERQDDFEQILIRIEQSRPLISVKKELKVLTEKVKQISDTSSQKLDVASTIKSNLSKYDDKIAQIESEVESKIGSAIDSFANSQLFDDINNHTSELNTEIKQIGTQLEQLYDQTSKPIEEVTELSTKIEKLSESRNQPAPEITQLSHKLEKLSNRTDQSIADLKEKFNLLEKSLNQVKEQIESSNSFTSPEVIYQTTAVEQSKSTFPFKWFANKQSAPVTDNIDEVTFINRFADAFEQADLAVLHIYHQLFLSSSIIVLNQPQLITAWINALGWQSYAYAIVASPTWSDANDWYDGGEFLFAKQDDKPKILFIYDFELGLVEAYLSPLLKIWRNSGMQQPHVKLVLVPSKRMECKHNPLLEPVLWLPDTWSNSQLAMPMAKPLSKPSKIAVSNEVFENWCGVPKSIKQVPQLLKKFPRFLTELRNADMIFPTYMAHGSETMLLALLKRQVDDDLAQNIVIESFILPWVAAHYGAGKVEEVVVRAKVFFK